jgi:hypothetical protein
MKRVLLMVFACGLMSISSYAQVSYYTFSQATNTFDTLITGKALVPSTSATGNYWVDSTATAGGTTAFTGIGLPIGFTFTYNSTNFDVFGVNADGWISFGQSALTPASVDMTCSTGTGNGPNAPISTASTAAANLQNRVSAFGRTMLGQATSQLTYATLGTAPNRTLVVEWKRFRRSATATTDNISFQIKLHETTNVVEFVYGTVTYSGNTSTTQVGLRGQANTDFFNRTTTTDWTATTAGTANNSTVAISATIYPPVGLTFTFTPPIVTANDAGLTVINSPNTPVTLGNNKVAVTIKNFGASNLTAATIAWRVNGTLQTPFTFTNAGLAQNATYGPDTIGTYNFATAGAYIIKAWTESPNGSTDGNHANDTITKTVYAQGYAALPFAENFDDTWISVMNTREVPSVYWLNTPNTGNSSWRRNDDGTSAAWTSTSGGYTPTGAGTTPHSARFHSRSATAGTTGTLDAYLNFTPAGTKALKFWHINTSGTDTLSVYMSNDGGTTFNLVQKFATATAWTQHFINLGTSTAANSIVRFSVTNLTSGTGQTDVGVDSVQVYVLSANDAGLTAINAPTTPVTIGSNPVTVTVMNYGAAVLTSASIGWSVNTVAQTSHAYSNAGLASGATDGPITIGTYNFATAGFYTIKAWTSLPNGNADADHTNDTVSKIVYVQPYAALPFTEHFDSTWVNKNAVKDVPDAYWTNTPSTGNNSFRRDDDTLSALWTEGDSAGYSPEGANGTIHSARFHTWYALNNTSGDMDLYINFTPTGGKQLDFWYMNADGADSLSVYLSTDAGATFTYLNKYLADTTWKEYTAYLGNSTAANCVLRFRTVSDYGYSDIGLDEVKVTVISGTLSTTATATPTAICVGSTSQLVASPTGGSGNYTYTWSPATGLSSTTGNNIGASPVTTTTYTVNVSDGANSASASVTVHINPLPVVNLGKDTIICKNQSITLHAGTASSYLWSTGVTTASIVIDTNNAVAGVATIWVSVTNSSGCSNTDTIKVTFIPCTGINEYGNDAVIAVYPNPTTGMTSIVVNGLGKNANLNIYNIQGQSVYSEKITGETTTELDLSALPKGIYIVRINNEKANVLSRLIIQ